jgi:hypothetical protein
VARTDVDRAGWRSAHIGDASTSHYLTALEEEISRRIEHCVREMELGARQATEIRVVVLLP